jgi:hypothetical protein
MLKSEVLMKKRLIVLSAMTLIMVVIAGCYMPAPTTSVGDSQTQVALFAQATLTKFAQQMTETQPPSSQDTVVPPTATLVPPTATNVPPTAVPPTATATSVPVVTVVPITPVPATATSQPGGTTRISFASGTTNYTVKETIPANTTKRYALRLTQYQLAEISLSGSTSAYIAITTEKGKELVNFSQKWTWYRDYASENGDWYIDVRTGAYASDITLYIQAPQRVSFESGKDTLIAKATVPAYFTHNFVAWANKDQVMKVSISPTDGLVLSIYKLGGEVLLSSAQGKTSYEGTLPKAGDYVISVTNTKNASSTFDINLNVK